MAAINRKQKRKTNQNCLGSSILELPFVLIILLIVTFAIMGFGWFFFRVQQLTNATRHGARVAIRYGATTTDVEGAVAGLLNPVGLDYDGPEFPASVDPNIGQAVTVDVTGKGLDLLNLDSATILRIPIPDTFKASVTMAKEGP